MISGQALRPATGGFLAMAAALGIGRFVYTPILPSMIDALGWTTATAGVVASAHFLGYLFGALLAGPPQNRAEIFDVFAKGTAPLRKILIR